MQVTLKTLHINPFCLDRQTNSAAKRSDILSVRHINLLTFKQFDWIFSLNPLKNI